MRPTRVQSRPRGRAPTVVLAQVVDESAAEPAVVEDEPDTSDVNDVVAELPTPVHTPVAAPPNAEYLQLYTQYVRMQEENVRLRRKVIRLEEDLKQWKEKKTSKRQKLEGEDLKNAIVDIILNSDLNIDSIPDDVEREIYSFIINQISASAGAFSCLRKLFVCG
jgi:hypothetical protein